MGFTMSTCNQSAPSWSMVFVQAAPRAAKSADRIDGAIIAGGVMVEEGRSGPMKSETVIEIATGSPKSVYAIGKPVDVSGTGIEGSVFPKMPDGALFNAGNQAKDLAMFDTARDKVQYSMIHDCDAGHPLSIRPRNSTPQAKD